MPARRVLIRVPIDIVVEDFDNKTVTQFQHEANALYRHPQANGGPVAIGQTQIAGATVIAMELTSPVVMEIRNEDGETVFP